MPAFKADTKNWYYSQASGRQMSNSLYRAANQARVQAHGSVQ